MNDNEPHYKQVINYIRTEIENGNLKQGDRMPSEKELGERFGLSRQTIRNYERNRGNYVAQKYDRLISLYDRLERKAAKEADAEGSNDGWL